MNMTDESKAVQPFDVPKISRDPLDQIKIGDWCWVQYDDTKWDDKKEEHVKVGEHEDLMCVEEIGSNYVGLTRCSEHGSYNDRIHFNEFLKRCRPEPNWKAVLQTRVDEEQKAIQAKTQELIAEGQNVCLLAAENATEKPEPQSLLPVKVTVDPQKYKKDLIHLRNRMPKIDKEIKELGEELGVASKDMALPDLVRLGHIKKALGVVEDRIFTVELYCGLQETVKQIADGQPAPLETPVTIRQQMLYMDEETLFDYDDGGMDFKKIGQFDAWVAKPENLSRILPEPRGIVAFRVRRDPKDYGEARDIATAWAHMCWKEANEQTYILIRNGQQVFRIASEVDFTPRLIPMIGEIGEEQFKKIDYVWDEKDEHGMTKRERVETLVTPESVHFDDHVEKMEKLLRHYNRIVILIQGLLDRSMVFHPHPVINLRNPVHMEKWIVLMRDEERALPSNKVTFEEYQKQLNSTLRKGKWVYVDNSYDEGYKDGEAPSRYAGQYERNHRRRGWSALKMPRLCQVETMKRDGSMVRVSWPWGRRSKPLEGKWIESKTKPGWGHYERIWETDRMCHEWISVTRVLNVSDYHLGDYKMFLCDRALQGQYLKWAQYLLTAEDWARDRVKGLPPERDKKAQARE